MGQSLPYRLPYRYARGAPYGAVQQKAKSSGWRLGDVPYSESLMRTQQYSCVELESER